MHPQLTVNNHGIRAIRRGNCTLFNTTVADAPSPCEPGEIVRILDPAGQFAAIGYYNSASKIPLRILSLKDEPVDRAFWVARIRSAWSFRTRFYPETDSFRLIYGESDGMPGLTVDYFSGIFVLQVSTAGMERHLDTIISILEEMFSVQAVIIANDSLSRKKEGLELFRQKISGEAQLPCPVIIDGLKHWIDPVNGQKTGFFLDHRLNRSKAAALTYGKTALDMFCYSGAFAVRAAAAGASQVTGIDISPGALDLATQSAALNNVESQCEFIKAEGFQFLKENAGKRVWDLVFLDPPSLVRGSGRARRNLNNYRKVNRLAVQCTAPNGILVTSICSYHVTREELTEMIADALTESGRTGRIFATCGAGPDHPVHPGTPGTDYLKCYFVALDYQ